MPKPKPGRYRQCRLSSILSEEGYTHLAFGALIGRSQSYVTRIAAGQILPTLPTIWRICYALGRDFEEVFPANPAWFSAIDGTPWEGVEL